MAIAAGAQIATTIAPPGTHHPPAGAGPGTSSTPSATPSAAAGTQAIAEPRATAAAICVSEAPRALRMVSSPDRRITTIRAASSSVTAAATARLT